MPVDELRIRRLKGYPVYRWLKRTFSSAHHFIHLETNQGIERLVHEPGKANLIINLLVTRKNLPARSYMTSGDIEPRLRELVGDKNASNLLIAIHAFQEHFESLIPKFKLIELEDTVQLAIILQKNRRLLIHINLRSLLQPK